MEGSVENCPNDNHPLTTYHFLKIAIYCKAPLISKNQSSVMHNFMKGFLTIPVGRNLLSFMSTDDQTMVLIH